MTEPKACPWCGGKPLMQTHPPNPDDPCVICDDCDVDTCQMTPISKWNDQRGVQAAVGEVERLEARIPDCHCEGCQGVYYPDFIDPDSADGESSGVCRWCVACDRNDELSAEVERLKDCLSDLHKQAAARRVE